MIKSALFSKTYTCLFDSASFKGHKLYPSAREKYERVDEYFDMPIYVSPVKDDQFCNYTLIEVKVCPQCLFASNDDRHFKTDDPYNVPMEAPDNILQAVTNTLAARKATAAAASNDLQSIGRSAADALVSYKLAISSSISLYHGDVKAFAVELPRIGKYGLKGAQICLENNLVEEREKWLQLSLEYFKKTLDAELWGALYYRSLYQLSALAIYFSQDIFASRAFEILRKEGLGAHSTTLSAYTNRLRKIWQDRDYHRRGASL